jgi:transcriptional regulator with XRE-family HTH domain
MWRKKMKTGLVIKELRIKKGLTQEELSERTELSTRTIQRIENGEVDPRSYTLRMIAKALDVDFSFFVEDEAKEDEAKKDQLILGLVHLSGLCLLFIPTILIWNNKKNKVKGITEHYNYVISFQLTIWLIFILPGIAMHYFLSLNHFNNRAPYLIFIGVVIGVVFSIINTKNVINNQPYKRFSFIKEENKDKKDSK